MANCFVWGAKWRLHECKSGAEARLEKLSLRFFHFRGDIIQRLYIRGEEYIEVNLA